MAGKILRGAIVGASTLLGKELAEELNNSKTVAWDLTLLESPAASGKITSAGDEALLIQPISSDKFAEIDVAFFAADGPTTLSYWKVARAAGAAIVDLTGALEPEPGVLVRSPSIDGSTAPDRSTVAVVSAHPAAIMLASAHAKLQPLGLTRMAATVLQPASEFGSKGVEEMHQQTVGLLSFKPLKKETFDAQVAFNIVPSFGSAVKRDLAEVSKQIVRHGDVLLGNIAADTLTLQLLQAPVFHGYTASVFLELAKDVSGEAVRDALLQVGLMEEEQSPSNENAAGKGEVLFRVANAGPTPGGGHWLWMAADNLRLAARNAAACASELIDSSQRSRVN